MGLGGHESGGGEIGGEEVEDRAGGKGRSRWRSERSERDSGEGCFEVVQRTETESR